MTKQKLDWLFESEGYSWESEKHTTVLSHEWKVNTDLYSVQMPDFQIPCNHYSSKFDCPNIPMNANEAHFVRKPLFLSKELSFRNVVICFSCDRTNFLSLVLIKFKCVPSFLENHILYFEIKSNCLEKLRPKHVFWKPKNFYNLFQVMIRFRVNTFQANMLSGPSQWQWKKILLLAHFITLL